MNRSCIFFKSKTIGSRLRYVVSELFERRMGLDVNFISGDMALPDDGFTIGYGVEDGHLFFPASGILDESGEFQYSFVPSENCDESVIIHSNGATTKGDLPGMAFWLLSRYEEYQNPSITDQHGRFPSSANTLVKHDLHSIPLIDKWISDLSLILSDSGIQVHSLPPENTLSFDLDNPTAFLHKNPARQFLAAGKDLLQLHFGKLLERFMVMAGLKKDPFDNMTQLGEIVSGKNMVPDLFVWIGDYGPHDKGLPHTSEYFRKLISSLARQFSIGLHPSYASFGNEKQMQIEKSRLEEITGFKIKKNRFHFLRFRVPESYRILLNLGFNEDHSMGFSDRMGFRAGTGQPFYWYDLQKEEKTSLLICPFSMMDSTAHFHMKISSGEFLETLRHQIRNQPFQGSIHAIFHNEHPSWKGWENMVSRFIDATNNLP